MQALLPVSDPIRAASIIKAEGFEDEAEAILLGMIAKESPSRPKPKHGVHWRT